jgi:hypothetical protein
MVAVLLSVKISRKQSPARMENINEQFNAKSIEHQYRHPENAPDAIMLHE